MKDFFYGILALAMIVFIMYLFSDSVEEFNDYAKESVGKEVVVNKDTLIIVNWNTLNKDFILSNGVAVDERIVRNYYGK